MRHPIKCDLWVYVPILPGWPDTDSVDSGRASPFTARCRKERVRSAGLATREPRPVARLRGSARIVLNPHGPLGVVRANETHMHRRSRALLRQVRGSGSVPVPAPIVVSGAPVTVEPHHASVNLASAVRVPFPVDHQVPERLRDTREHGRVRSRARVDDRYRLQRVRVVQDMEISEVISDRVNVCARLRLDTGKLGIDLFGKDRMRTRQSTIQGLARRIGERFIVELVVRCSWHGIP